MGTFWKNFWKETGKNTGKWTSNKVFGNSGWATPRRHIFGDGESDVSSKSSSKKRNKHSFSSESDDGGFTGNDLELINIINSYDFKENVDDVCNSIDQLFSYLETPVKKAARQKIKTGIFKLERLGAYNEARYYKRELNRDTRNAIIMVAVFVLIIVIGNILVFLGVLK